MGGQVPRRRARNLHAEERHDAQNVGVMIWHPPGCAYEEDYL